MIAALALSFFGSDAASLLQNAQDAFRQGEWARADRAFAHAQASAALLDDRSTVLEAMLGRMDLRLQAREPDSAARFLPTFPEPGLSSEDSTLWCTAKARLQQAHGSDSALGTADSALRVAHRNPNRALVGAEQPSFQQRDHAMDARKQMLSLFLLALYMAIMNVSFQPQIGSPAVGPDRASRRNCRSNKPMQALAGRVRYRTQTNASDALSILFGGDDNQSLFFRSSSDCSGFLSAPVSLVHLDNAIQSVAARANHGPAQLMQHRPGRLVAAQAEYPLETQGAHAVLLAGDLPHGAKPDRQRYVTVLKDGPRSDRHLVSAMAAKPTCPPNRPGIGSRTPRTDPSAGPTQCREVLNTGFFGAKASLQLK